MTVSSHITASAFAHPVALVTNLTDRIVQHYNYRKTVRALSALTFRELKDLGLERATLDQAARIAVYGV